MKKLLIIFLINFLTGCSVINLWRDNTAELRILERESIRNSPVCNSSKSCDDMMEIAKEWVITHSNMKLQTATNTLIETETDASGANLAMMVEKQPIEPGRYRIVLLIPKAECILESCKNKEIDLRTDFNNELNKFKSDDDVSIQIKQL